MSLPGYAVRGTRYLQVGWSYSGDSRVRLPVRRNACFELSYLAVLGGTPIDTPLRCADYCHCALQALHQIRP